MPATETTQTFFLALSLIVAMVALQPGCQPQGELSAKAASEPKIAFNPKDVNHLEFFVESVRGIVLATNTSEEARRNTRELTPNHLVWTDHERFPHGTVRWWEDQSPMGRKPSRRANKPWPTGRAFGQDDEDRPGYIPDGCNGKPCVRGGFYLPGDPEMRSKSGHYRKQACYFELQPEDRFSFEGPFSFFILVRPVQQDKNFVYFGVFHWSTLHHVVKDNSLRFKNMKFANLTGPDAVEIGKWQLIEVHRDAKDNLQCVVNGKDVTKGMPSVDGPFRFVHLMNDNKNIGQRGDPFAGDLSAFALYSDALTETHKKNIRRYFDGIYGYMDR